MTVVVGSAARSDLPVIRGSGPWAYDFTIQRGAWDQWKSDLEDGTWPGVVLAMDHEMRTAEVVAATADRSLSFDLVDVGGFEFLTFEAKFPEDEDRRTPSMSIIEAHLKPDESGRSRVNQVSVGALLLEYVWEFAEDDDNDYERDRLTGVTCGMYELSFVPFGAQGDRASAAVASQALSSARVGVDDYLAKLGDGPMRLSTLDQAGEPVAFDARASRDAAYAVRHSATVESDQSGPSKGAVQRARQRMRSRRK